jgi:hypothetical protein
LPRQPSASAAREASEKMHWSLITLALGVGFLGNACYHRAGISFGVGAARLCQTLALAAGVYCVIAGVVMFMNWTDPLAGADPDAVAQSAARSRRGGLFLLLLRLWPIVLIGLGGLHAFAALLGLRTPIVLKRADRAMR